MIQIHHILKSKAHNTKNIFNNNSKNEKIYPKLIEHGTYLIGFDVRAHGHQIMYYQSLMEKID